MNVPGMNGERDLEGLSALVTGATSGIGRAAAEELGRRGAEIVVHGRDAGRGAAVASTIAAAGGKARFVAADLTDPAQVDHLAEGAGWNQPGPTASPPPRTPGSAPSALAARRLSHGGRGAATRGRYSTGSRARS
jgi:short subunit dehydrogenase